MMYRTYMDPDTEKLSQHTAHVRQWKRWYCIEGRHFDNGRRHVDQQLANPPANAQCHFQDVVVIKAPMTLFERFIANLTACTRLRKSQSTAQFWCLPD